MNATAFPLPREAPRHGWAVLVLALVALAMFLPGLATLPPMDRDEPRFAQASKQMLQTGDYVSIRFQDTARNKKPVGIYWLQAAAVSIGDRLGVEDALRTIWLYRVPSLIGAIVAVLGTYWAGLALTTQQGAFLGALLMSTTLLLTVEAHLAKTDAVLVATVAVAMGALARVYRVGRALGRPFPLLNDGADLRPGILFAFWTALAVGILVKGPITPMIPVFAAVALSVKERSGRWLLGLRPVPGLLWTLLLVLPWFVLILLRTKGAFLADSVGHDMLGKVAGVQELHGAPPGTYLAVFWLTGWPMAPFAALAIPYAWQHRQEPKVAFLLAWILPAWILFELFPTKLPHYVLPLFPALALLAAMGLIGRMERPRASRVAAIAGMFGLLCIMPLAVSVVLGKGTGLLWDQLPPTTAMLGAATSVLVVVLAGLAAWSLRIRDARRSVLAATGAALASYLFVLGHLTLPQVSPRLSVSGRMASAGRAALPDDCVRGRFASAGDHEPSLVFLAGTDLLLTDAAGAATFLQGDDCRVAFVERNLEPAFLAALPLAENARLASRVVGTAINGPKSLDIGVYVGQRQRP